MLADCSLSPLCLHALIIEDWSRNVLRGAWAATVQGLNAAFMDRPDVRRGFERDRRVPGVIGARCHTSHRDLGTAWTGHIRGLGTRPGGLAPCCTGPRSGGWRVLVRR